MRNMMVFGITREVETTIPDVREKLYLWEFHSSQNLAWQKFCVLVLSTDDSTQISTSVLYWKILPHNKEKFSGFPNFNYTKIWCSKIAGHVWQTGEFDLPETKFYEELRQFLDKNLL